MNNYDGIERNITRIARDIVRLNMSFLRDLIESVVPVAYAEEVSTCLRKLWGKYRTNKFSQ